MKKLFLITGLILNTYVFNAQTNATTEYINLNEQEYTIYSSDYKAAKTKLENFIRFQDYTLIKQEETKTSHYYEFNIPTGDLRIIDSLASGLGYVSNKQLISYNNEDKLDAAKIDLAFQENKKKEYEQMLLKMDSVKSVKYYEHWEKIRAIESEISWNRKKINQLEKISPLYRVKINIHDEQINPTNTRISFVSMPGLQYSVLFTESPKAGKSYPVYQGVFLKYLFTKGKSYFSLGVLKSNNNNLSDTLAYKANSEIFNLAFGQDFYSKRFGRGSNRFFNLYASYQVGASLFFTSKTAITIPFANPGIGLEVFKNKNVLIDSNVYYYLPLADDYNRNLRGWLANVSFNFVF
ncbi:MAG TPA: hypothetical protein VNZ49_09330 [Bacteroidia bacterium]|jgi:hypothetical protein|nr:hypothetical protein [Bacteroidia bacterium]